MAGAKSLAAIAEWAADAPPNAARLDGPCREPGRGPCRPGRGHRQQAGEVEGGGLEVGGQEQQSQRLLA
ncbi:hypothetical protein [Streptomyces griseoluteus]|uniref:hypothetical protein n=1 Tax=Streptomyces griseoluteus TaxID=29306 RepID=UPI0037FD11D5